MKLSMFNVFFEHDDNIIAYNGFSNEFLILDPELHEILISVSKSNDWNELKSIHSEFYETLVQKGFIVSFKDDEVLRVKNVVYEAELFQEKSYTLTINPTMNCNFKCWYCYETHIKDSKMSNETIGGIVNHVKHVLETKPKLEDFILSWFGGEPLLYFDKTVLPILKEIVPLFESRGVKFSSGFTTNGFLINQDVINQCKKYKADFFQITLDGHRERHNKVRFVSKQRGSYDEIIQNIKLSLKNEVSVSVRINISEETLENILNIIHDFEEISELDRQFLSFSFHEVWQEEKELTRDIQAIVHEFRKKKFNTLFEGNNTDAMRNSCYADKKNHATINYNGDVFKCTARDFESKSREGLLNKDGIIEWNEIYERRMSSKFKNAPCLECKLLPICNGGCTQHALESQGKDYCIYNYNEDRKTDVIKDKYLYLIS